MNELQTYKSKLNYNPGQLELDYFQQTSKKYNQTNIP